MSASRPTSTRLIEGMRLAPDTGMDWESLLGGPHPEHIDRAAGAMTGDASSLREAYVLAYKLDAAGLLRTAVRRGDFYEDDEPVEDVVAGFEAGTPVDIVTPKDAMPQASGSNALEDLEPLIAAMYQADEKVCAETGDELSGAGFWRRVAEIVHARVVTPMVAELRTHQDEYRAALDYAREHLAATLGTSADAPLDDLLSEVRRVLDRYTKDCDIVRTNLRDLVREERGSADSRDAAWLSARAAEMIVGLRVDLGRERASRQDWAAEAMRLDAEVERLRTSSPLLVSAMDAQNAVVTGQRDEALDAAADLAIQRAALWDLLRKQTRRLQTRKAPFNAIKTDLAGTTADLDAASEELADLKARVGYDPDTGMWTPDPATREHMDHLAAELDRVLQELRRRNREYGRASQTIGALRHQLSHYTRVREWAASVAQSVRPLEGERDLARRELDYARQDLTDLRARYAEATRLLADVLRLFHEQGHPGYPALRTGWIREANVSDWRATLRRLENQGVPWSTPDGGESDTTATPTEPRVWDSEFDDPLTTLRVVDRNGATWKPIYSRWKKSDGLSGGYTDEFVLSWSSLVRSHGPVTEVLSGEDTTEHRGEGEEGADRDNTGHAGREETPEKLRDGGQPARHPAVAEPMPADGPTTPAPPSPPATPTGEDAIEGAGDD